MTTRIFSCRNGSHQNAVFSLRHISSVCIITLHKLNARYLFEISVDHSQPNVEQPSQNNDEVKNVPVVSKIILKGKKKDNRYFIYAKPFILSAVI